MSTASPTGYDNIDTGVIEPNNKGNPDFEVYLYDATENRLVCASCDPDGASPAGDSYLPLSGVGTYQPTFLSEDGMVFFSSQEALVPQDINGATDVYEYENGHVYLISGGKGTLGSYLDTVSPNGENVFFTTWEQLVAQDQDEQADLYDARADGGFPAPAPALAACDGEACRGSSPPAPALGSPASTAFSGVGNLAPSVQSKPAEKSKPKSLTRAQKLTKALTACKKESKKRRAVCESQARKRYGAKSKAKKASRVQGKGGR